jgi:hypothetical protein
MFVAVSGIVVLGRAAREVFSEKMKDLIEGRV